MPKAQRYCSLRITKAPAPQKNRRKEDGRPKGTLKKFRFEQTRLGFMLKYESPAVYNVIMRLTPPSPWREPAPLLIRMVCASSDDPSLKKAKFFRYLEEYSRDGLYCRRAKMPTPQRQRYYRSIRKHKLAKKV